MTTWYRYEAIYYAAPVGEFDERLGVGSVDIVLREYRVTRTTEKGVWLVRDLGQFGTLSEEKRFVLTNARKRFACPTPAEAMASFLARRRAEVRIYKARIARAERAIEAAGRVLAELVRSAA